MVAFWGRGALADSPLFSIMGYDMLYWETLSVEPYEGLPGGWLKMVSFVLLHLAETSPRNFVETSRADVPHLLGT